MIILYITYILKHTLTLTHILTLAVTSLGYLLFYVCNFMLLYVENLLKKLKKTLVVEFIGRPVFPFESGHRLLVLHCSFPSKSEQK